MFVVFRQIASIYTVAITAQISRRAYIAYVEQPIQVVQMKNCDDMHQQLQLHCAKDIMHVKVETATLSALHALTNSTRTLPSEFMQDTIAILHRSTVSETLIEFEA